MRRLKNERTDHSNWNRYDQYANYEVPMLLNEWLAIKSKKSVRERAQRGQMSSEEVSQRREFQGRLGPRREASQVKGES